MLQSHWPNIKLPNEEIFSAFSKLKKQGKIKCFGLSNPFLNILLDKNSFTDRLYKLKRYLSK